MVIRYSIQELNAIGELVIIRECLSNAAREREGSEKFQKFMQECDLHIKKYQIEMDIHRLTQPQDQSPDSSSQNQLTSSVAEFFKKAQQNFYVSTSIDPTKIRRLSEIEAEIVRGRS